MEKIDYKREVIARYPYAHSFKTSGRSRWGDKKKREYSIILFGYPLPKQWRSGNAIGAWRKAYELIMTEHMPRERPQDHWRECRCIAVCKFHKANGWAQEETKGRGNENLSC